MWIGVPFLLSVVVGRWVRRSWISRWMVYGALVINGGGGLFAYTLALVYRDPMTGIFFELVPGGQLAIAVAASLVAVIAVE